MITNSLFSFNPSAILNIHDELLEQQSHYAKLWEMQAGGFLPDGEYDDDEEEEFPEEEQEIAS